MATECEQPASSGKRAATVRMIVLRTSMPWRPTINRAGLGLRRSADRRANRVPKPSRPNFTSQGNERIRRDSQISNGSNTSPPAPNDAAPGARGKNRKAAEPTVAPNVPGEQGTTVEGRDKDNAPRNVRKQAQGSEQNVAPSASGTPGARGKNRKVAEPTIAPNVPGEQGTTVEGRGKDNAPRNCASRQRAVIKMWLPGASGDQHLQREVKTAKRRSQP